MNKVDYLFTVLAEEAAEVAQAATKCLRFGPEEVYAPIGVTNSERLIEEFNDLLTVFQVLQEMGELPGTLIREDSIKAKKEKINKYLEYSRSLKRVV